MIHRSVLGGDWNGLLWGPGEEEEARADLGDKFVYVEGTGVGASDKV